MAQACYIGDLRQRVGLNPKTIRYYEEIGLLPKAERSVAGYRVYGPEDVNRLEFIRKAQLLGLSLREVRAIIEIRQHGQLPCHHVRKLLARKLKELERQINQMVSFQPGLHQYVAELEERVQAANEAVICPHIEGYPGKAIRGRSPGDGSLGRPVRR